MAFRTKAARPKSVVPTRSSLAVSGTAGRLSVTRASRPDGAAMTTEDVRTAAADDTATVERGPTRAMRADEESIDQAKPTGTTKAATSAANNNTRYRLRIPPIFPHRPESICRGDRQVGHIGRQSVKVQAMCHGDYCGDFSMFAVVSARRAEPLFTTWASRRDPHRRCVTLSRARARTAICKLSGAWTQQVCLRSLNPRTVTRN